ncbi:MAG: hypothetical protein IJI27_00090 [Oscillospiraceae bacterium]|nr:hypothetical protein [Oscillospiraceae bacterium]
MRRELDALSKHYDRLRAEIKRTSAALSRSRTDRERMARFLETVPGGQNRMLLRLRYLEGLTVPQVQQALEAQGLFYGQRHVERLLSAAEQAAGAAWTSWMEQEVRNERNQH